MRKRADVFLQLIHKNTRPACVCAHSVVVVHHGHVGGGVSAVAQQ